MTSFRFRVALFPLAVALAVALAGCSLIISNTRQVKRHVNLFASSTAGKQYKNAAAYMTKDFTYLTIDNKTYGVNSAKAFFAKIDQLKHTQFFITVVETKETSETSVWVKATLQSRKADAVSTENHFWEISMIWVKIDKKWYLKEAKDISETRASRS